MKKRMFGVGALALAAAVVVGVVGMMAFPGEAAAYGGWNGRGARQAGAPAQGTPTDAHLIDDAYQPTAAEIEALNLALQDEYKAWAIYEQVIEDFGNVRPFTSIQRAEEKHIEALVRLFDAYELEVPANEWVGNVDSYDTLTDACAAGVQAEIDNADLYEQLFDATNNPDIMRVFTSLQQASLTRHLPAFERCAS